MRKMEIFLIVSMFLTGTAFADTWLTQSQGQKMTLKQVVALIQQRVQSAYRGEKVARDTGYQQIWNSPYGYTPAQVLNEMSQEGIPAVLLFEETPVIDNSLSIIDNTYVPQQPPYPECVQGSSNPTCWQPQVNGDVDIISNSTNGT